jgi:hypothetical protein
MSDVTAIFNRSTALSAYTAIFAVVLGRAHRRKLGVKSRVAKSGVCGCAPSWIQGRNPGQEVGGGQSPLKRAIFLHSVGYRIIDLNKQILK